jgi:hypothetical protein
MAPEHISGKNIDLRADLFAAGILLWELLSGRRLFKTKDEDETLAKAKAAQIPPLVDRGFPAYAMLAAIVHKALAREPRLRFQTGQEFILALEDYMHESGQIVSQLRFSNFLMDNFGESLMKQRRERERNLAALMDLQKKEEGRPNTALIPVDGSTGVGFSLQENPITQSLLREDDDELFDEPDTEGPPEAKDVDFDDDRFADDVPVVPRDGPAAPAAKHFRGGATPKKPGNAVLWVFGIAFVIVAAAAAAYFLEIF